MTQQFAGSDAPPAGGLGSRLTRRRQLYGLGVAAVGAPLLTLLLVLIAGYVAVQAVRGLT